MMTEVRMVITHVWEGPWKRLQGGGGVAGNGLYFDLIHWKIHQDVYFMYVSFSKNIFYVYNALTVTKGSGDIWQNDDDGFVGILI